MADLFEEYSALQLPPEKPVSKLRKLPKTPLLLCLVGIALVVCVILLIHGFSDPGETVQPSAALKKCQTALAEFRSLDCYYVLRETQFDGDDLLVTHSEQTYRRCGEDRLAELRIDEIQSKACYLQSGTSQFYGAGYSETIWDADVLTADLWAIPWLETYPWNTGEITLLSKEAVEGAQVITVQIVGDPYQSSDSGVESYQASLRLGENGALVSVTLTFTESTGKTVISTFTVLSTDRVEIYQAIDDAYQEAARPAIPAIASCRNALKNFRSLDSYCVLRENQFDGEDALVTHSEQTFHKCGADRLIQFRMDEAQFMEGYLQVGTEQFKGNGSDSGIMAWSPAELTEDVWSIPWLETYRWDYADVTLVGTDGEQVITVRIAEDPYQSSNSGVESYHATFCLDESGALISVTLSYTDPTIGNVTSCFTVLSTDRETISQTIQQTYREACANR